MEQKNRGGRPSNAELAARGITKTELEAGLKILKKIYGSAIDKMIEISDDTSLTIKERFKMKSELVSLYINLVKSDVSLRIQINRGTEGGDQEPEDKPLAPVFNLAK